MKQLCDFLVACTLVENAQSNLFPTWNIVVNFQLSITNKPKIFPCLNLCSFEYIGLLSHFSCEPHKTYYEL
jgi:hypothetical protein